MPFVNRHSKKKLIRIHLLEQGIYENTIKSCKRFLRCPSTIFSYAEGTRVTKEKHRNQQSPYNNLLTPKIGGIGYCISAMPAINTLVDYSLVYESSKRDAWSF
jgi:hypothetical protein